MKHEDMLALEDMTIEQITELLEHAIAAFLKDFKNPTPAGQARARRASSTITHGMKQFRKLSIAAHK
jgi:hypothetical protein